MQVQRQIDHLLAQRAAEWMETLKTGGDRERAAFAQWLSQSKLHVEHYLELAAIDYELLQLDPAQCPDVDALLAQASPNVVRLKRSLRVPEPGLARFGRGRMWQAGGMAVAASLIGALAFWFWTVQEVTTTAGEQRTLTLADGSVVSLNTQTALRIDFSKQERTVRLESGEAVFKVAPEAARPFVVRTRTAAVRAVGTQFNVYQRPQDIVVSVLEGRVQISTRENPVQTLSAGEEAQVQTNGRVEKRARADVQKALAWRQRRLNFDETPLEEMVREFNRYSRSVRLRLEDVPSGTYRYGGVFDADDPESLAALLQRESDLEVRVGEDEILIRRR